MSAWSVLSCLHHIMDGLNESMNITYCDLNAGWEVMGAEIQKLENIRLEMLLLVK